MGQLKRKKCFYMSPSAPEDLFGLSARRQVRSRKSVHSPSTPRLNLSGAYYSRPLSFPPLPAKKKYNSYTLNGMEFAPSLPQVKSSNCVLIGGVHHRESTGYRIMSLYIIVPNGSSSNFGVLPVRVKTPWTKYCAHFSLHTLRVQWAHVR